MVYRAETTIEISATGYKISGFLDLNEQQCNIIQTEANKDYIY